jgi:hypothetical protein
MENMGIFKTSDKYKSNFGKYKIELLNSSEIEMLKF